MPNADAPESTTDDGWIKLKAPRLDQQDAPASGGDVDQSNIQAGTEAQIEGVASSTGTPDDFPENDVPDSFLVQWWPFLLFAPNSLLLGFFSAVVKARTELQTPANLR